MHSLRDSKSEEEAEDDRRGSGLDMAGGTALLRPRKVTGLGIPREVTGWGCGYLSQETRALFVVDNPVTNWVPCILKPGHSSHSCICLITGDGLW